MQDKFSLGIDIGGTKISAALVSSGDIYGDIIKKPTPTNKEALINEIFYLVDLFAKNNNLNSIGIATAGVVNVQTGEIISATENMAVGYTGTNYKKLIEDKFNIKTFVDNDANAATYGEYKRGAGIGYNDLVVITIGTGIGAGIIINGSLYRGKSYSAGECGFVPINNKLTRINSLVSYDCWEAFASGTGLQETAKNMASDLTLGIEFIETLNTYTIIKLIKNKDQFGLKVYDKWLEDISIGLVSIITILASECIILGGSMAEFVDFEKLKHIITNKIHFDFNIVKAQLNNNAGIIGAALLSEFN